MTAETKFDIYTASAQDLTARVAAALAGEHMNFSDKLDKLSDLKFRLTSDGQLMLNWIDFDRRGRTPEVIAAHRRYVQAEVDWLIANPGDDLTPDRVALFVRMATGDLPHVQQLTIAVNWCKEVEEYHESEPNKKSETLRKLESKLYDATKEVERHLRSSITLEQSDLLATLNARTFRFKHRFRLQRTNLGFREMHLRRLIDFAHTQHRRRLLHASFERSINHAATVKEVKQICACWHTACQVDRRDGASFVTGDGFEIIPQC